MRSSLSTLVARAIARAPSDVPRPEAAPPAPPLPKRQHDASKGLERWAAEWENLTKWLQELDSALASEPRSPAPLPEPTPRPSTWGLLVRPIPRFSTVRTIQGLLEATPGIDQVRLERLEQGAACFQITSNRATPSEAVVALAQLGARQSSSSGNMVEIEIGGDQTTSARSLAG